MAKSLERDCKYYYVYNMRMRNIMNMHNKGLIAAAVLGLALSFSNVYSTPAIAAPAETSVSVNVHVQQEAAIDWTKGAESAATATGLGFPPDNVGNRGHVLARRAAIVDAYRLLAETIQGVQIDSDTTIESMVLQSDTVKARVAALIKGARIVDEGANEDGSYFVKVSVPLFGVGKSVANAVLPEATKNVVSQPAAKVDEKTTPLTKEEIKEVRSVTYTGVIVDASGMGLEPTFSPVIMDTNGRVIYGMQNIDKDMAISQGMVEYATDLQTATGGTTRAGANPLVISATTVKGGVNSVNPVNVVVSVEDGDKILLANEQADMFGKCAVVFVK